MVALRPRGGSGDSCGGSADEAPLPGLRLALRHRGRRSSRGLSFRHAFRDAAGEHQASSGQGADRMREALIFIMLMAVVVLAALFAGPKPRRDPPRSAPLTAPRPK